ncbi:MAG: hypothetical protein RL477_1355 [Pseudomonadota bacterium]
MRNNQPVSNTEINVGSDITIVSKTDTGGKITYVNDDFVKISGFSEQELLNAPHNIVRHPDMPKEAFADLWATLKKGMPWSGAVKNRTKSGDYYWVQASASPLWENGRIAGYMSIRTTLPAADKQACEELYARMRNGQAEDIRLEHGIVSKKSWKDRFAFMSKSIKARLITLAATLAVLMALIGAAGLTSTGRGNGHLQSVYNDRLIPIAQISEINERMLQNISFLYQATVAARSGKAVTDTEAKIKENVARITELWTAYMATYMEADEKAIAAKYADLRKDYVQKGLLAGIEMTRSGKFQELEGHVVGTVEPLFAAAKVEAEKLLKLQDREARATFNRASSEFWVATGIVLGAIAFALLVAFLLSRKTIGAITGPANQLIKAMGSIAQGNFNNTIEIRQLDEIGTALNHLKAMQAKLGFDRAVMNQETDLRQKAEAEKLERARKDAEAQAEQARAAEERARKLDTLIQSFDRNVSATLETLSSASTELQSTAQAMSSTAEETSNQATAVSAAAEQMSSNVQTVAAAGEELSASITEISRQVTRSMEITKEAVGTAVGTNEQIKKLADSAQKIGDVVSLISDIASQTNLLALNATIEAARAGEAGKGFAVVASEVKSLSQQTAKATEDIGTKIAEIQSETTAAVGAIDKIARIVDQINEITATVASAVEEQGASTREIASNVQEAAKGTQEVTSNITGVTQAAGETGAAASQVLSSSGDLARQGERLREEVSRFLAGIRAA